MSTIGKANRRDACPLCGKATQAEFKPFCGQGCRDRDLLNWLGDGYRVPGPPAGSEDLAEGLDSRPEPPL